jgi:hypothetical protein
MIDYLWIALSWFLINVFAKLLINSVERLYKERIDRTVSAIPGAAKRTLFQLLRLGLLLFFAPAILMVSIVPSRFRKGPIKEILYLRRVLFSPREFRERLPLFWFFLKHPRLWIDPQAHEEELDQLILKLIKEGKFHPVTSARLTSHSS